MTLADVEWKTLRGAIIALLIAIAIASVALMSSFKFSEKQQALFKRDRAQLLSARGQYQTLDEEEDLIAAYLPRYVGLEQGGIIGREQRLDWIDSLRESARAVRVPSLQYTIEAQRPFDAGSAFNAGEYKLYASTVRLNVGLLHEEDLFNLLSRFRRRVAGLFGVRECEFGQRNESVVMAADAVNVSATCELQFITIRRERAGGA